MKTFSIKNPFYRRLAFIAFISFVAINLSCEPEQAATNDLELTISKDSQLFKKADKVSVYYGPTQSFGGGVARSAVALDKNGIPHSVSLLFSEKVFSKLPEDHKEISLELHNKAKHLITDHIDFGWNPEGHEPPGIYDIPHFDIHYYWISMEEQMQINNGELAEILPGTDYIPQTYFPTPEYVPNMGKHWLSYLAKELDPNNVFDQTFIFGSYNGEFIFNEPMITLDYFMDKNFPDSIGIPQPSSYQRAGYYPTAFKVEFDEVKKMYSVSLINFVWFP